MYTYTKLVVKMWSWARRYPVNQESNKSQMIEVEELFDSSGNKEIMDILLYGDEVQIKEQ